MPPILLRTLILSAFGIWVLLGVTFLLSNGGFPAAAMVVSAIVGFLIFLRQESRSSP